MLKLKTNENNENNTIYRSTYNIKKKIFVDSRKSIFLFLFFFPVFKLKKNTIKHNNYYPKKEEE